MKDTKEETKKPELMTQLMALLSKHEQAYNQQRVFHRAIALVMAEIFSFGRHTITQLLLTLGLTDEDWTAWYRLFSHERFQEEACAEVMVKEMLGQTNIEEPFVVGGDGFHVPRSSQEMAGTGWMKGLNTATFRPGLQRGQRYVEVSWLPTVHNGYSRAFPYRCLPAFTPKSIPAKGIAPKKEVTAVLEILAWTRAIMVKIGRGTQQIVNLGDGNYDSQEYWSHLPENTIGIVRTARNRALYYLPKEGSHGNRKYGIKARAPHKWLRKRKLLKKQKVMIRGQERNMRYRVCGPFLRTLVPNTPLFLLVIGGAKRPKGSRRQNYKPCFFLVSAVANNKGQWVLPFPIKQILTWLWQRWELEIAHRQMKSALGLGEKQCWQPQATVATVQWVVWVYSLLLLTGHLVWGHGAGPDPPGAWRKAPAPWSFNTLWSAFRAELWGHPNFRRTWTRSADNWTTFEPYLSNLFNAALASTRL